MKSYDVRFQAFRREHLHRFANMDPDDIVCELGIDTDTLMEALWLNIEQYISQEYTDDDDQLTPILDDE